MKDRNIQSLVLVGLMTCLVTVSTMFIKIPIPMTQGYVHLGDSMIFLSVLITGKRGGTAAAGIGSALGDLLGGYPHWILPTLIIKSLMGFCMGLLLERAQQKDPDRSGLRAKVLEGAGMVLGGAIMVAGYYIAASILYGSWVVPLASIPWNIGQFAVGMIIALLLSSALQKTPARKYFVGHSK